MTKSESRERMVDEETSRNALGRCTENLVSGETRRLHVLRGNRDRQLWFVEASVQRPAPMLLPADSAVGRRLGVVYSMLHGRDCAEICEDRPQVLVGNLAEPPPRHDFELARPHATCA